MKFRLLILMIAALTLQFGAPRLAQSSEALPLFTSSQTLAALLRRSALQSLSKGVQRLASEKESIKKFVLIFNLTDQQINRLRSTGSLSTRVPPKYVNRVKAIRFKKSHSFRSDSLRVAGVKTEKSRRSVAVEIDNSVLERLAFQPVDLQIFESGFDVVRLKFNPRGNVAGKLPEEFPPPADLSKVPFMYARIDSRRGIYGTLENLEALPIKTQFGAVKVPIAEIAGIRFNDGDPTRVFVVLKKGDVFSGEINLDSITLKSRWGEQALKVSELESLTLNQDVIFLRDAIDPKRWQLRTSIPVAAEVPSAGQNQNSNVPGVQNPLQFKPTQFNQNPPVVYP